MKINGHTKSLSAVAGIVTILGASILAPSAFAKPDKDVKQAKKDVARERRDVRRADTPREKREERSDLRDAQRDLARERAQNRNRPTNGSYRPGTGSYRPSTGFHVYSGEVVSVVSSSRVDVRISGRTYNVYTASRLPRGLNRGDIVRVDGVRSDSNDIRGGRVQIINNR